MGIFDGFSDADVDRIKSAGTSVRLPEGWSPIWESTAADKAYVLLSGEASVRRGREEVARIGPGEMFGEAGIVNHRLRNATVVALTELELLHFTADEVRRLRQEVPAFADAIDRQAAGRPDGRGDDA